MDDYWVHDLDPFLIRFSGDIGIRWYGLAYIAGLLVGWYLVKRWAREGRVPMPPWKAADLATAIGIGMIVGGRLGYCLLYSPHLLIQFTGDFPFWGVLAVNQGGMASHGGIVGFFIATWWFARRNRIPFLIMADVVGTLIPIGIFFGRMANFINGELWGRVIHSGGGVPWAVHFPDSIVEVPAAVLDARWADYQAQVPAAVGHEYSTWLAKVVPYSEEWYLFQSIMTDPRHPSQLYAAGMEGLITFGVTLFVHLRHRRPGLSAGTVLTCYSIMRIINENWRQWDIGHDPILGLTKGQIYSLPVLVTGLVLLAIALRRPRRPELYVDCSGIEPPDHGPSATSSQGRGSRTKKRDASAPAEPAKDEDDDRDR